MTAEWLYWAADQHVINPAEWDAHQAMPLLQRIAPFKAQV